jgi:hypothetical protein
MGIYSARVGRPREIPHPGNNQNHCNHRNGGDLELDGWLRPHTELLADLLSPIRSLFLLATLGFQLLA